jgi:hypothetical protein
VKTAILISGQCRTLDVCLPNLVEQVLRFLPGADLWVSVANGPDAGQANLFHTVGMRLRMLEAIDQPTLPEFDYREQSAGGNYYIGEGPHDATIVQRILRQAWHLRRVYDFAAGSGEGYEAYVRLRPDQWFTVGVAGLPEITPLTAAVPWWGSFDGVNDRFAVLGKTAAEAYCWWPRLDHFLGEGCRFHPETLTEYALRRAGCKVVHLPAFASTLKRDAAGQVIVREPEVLPQECRPLLVQRAG